MQVLLQRRAQFAALPLSSWPPSSSRLPCAERPFAQGSCLTFAISNVLKLLDASPDFCVDAVHVSLYDG